MVFKVGDKVHYWSRSIGVKKSKCHRAIIVEISSDGNFARVRRLNISESVPVQSVLVSRLKEGWNNWLDQDGKPNE